MKKETYKHGMLEYIVPSVTLLAITPIGVAELATRTCYLSHAGSDNETIRDVGDGKISESITDDLYSACKSHLVERSVHANHHESIIEHISCSILVKNTNRAVLQELARHRVGMSLSVQSTRYTLNELIKLFIASQYDGTKVGSLVPQEVKRDMFVDDIKRTSILNIVDEEIQDIKIGSIYDQMLVLYNLDNNGFAKSILSKSAFSLFENRYSYESMEKYRSDLFNTKNKRNAGDTIKSIVVDEMFNLDLVVTFNLRSLKHFLKLRNSGAAWKPIQVLAQEIKKKIPEDYLGYIEKNKEKNV